MKREIVIRETPIGEEGNKNGIEDGERQVMVTSVYYDKGGPNYFCGGETKRGYYLSVTPYKVTEHFRSMLAFSGTKALLEEAARFSQGKLEEVSRSAKALEIETMLQSHVCAKMKRAA